MADTIDLRDFLSPEDYAALHPEAAADPEKKNLIPNPTDGTTIPTDPTSDSLPTDGTVPTPISQEVQLTPEQMAQEPSQVPQGVDLSASVSTLPQPSTDLPSIPTASSGIGGSDLTALPASIIPQYEKELRTNPIFDYQPTAPQPDLSTVQQDSTAQKVDILAGKSDKAPHGLSVGIPVNDNIPKDYDGHPVNLEMDGTATVDFGNGLNIPLSQLAPINKDFAKTNFVSAGGYIGGDKDIEGNKTNAESELKDFKQWEENGWGKIQPNTQGKLGFRVNDNPEDAEKINQIYQQRAGIQDKVDKIASDAGDKNNPDNHLGSYIGDLEKKYGVVLTNDQIAGLGSDTGRTALEQQLQAESLQKANPNLTPEQAQQQVQSQYNTHLAQGSDIAKNILFERLTQMRWGHDEDNTAEAEMVKSVMNDPTQLQRLGQYLTSDEGHAFVNSGTGKFLTTLDQKSFKRMFDGYRNWEQRQVSINNNVLDFQDNSAKLQMTQAAKSGDMQKVQQLQNTFAGIRQAKLQNQLQRQQTDQLLDHYDKSFSEVNYWNDKANEYYGKHQNFWQGNTFEDILNGASVVAANALRKTARGVLSVAFSPMNFTDSKEDYNALNSYLGNELEMKGVKLHKDFEKYQELKYGNDTLVKYADGTVYKKGSDGNLIYLKDAPKADWKYSEEKSDTSFRGLLNSTQSLGWDIYLAGKVGTPLLKGASAVGNITKNLITAKNILGEESLITQSLAKLSQAAQSGHAATDVGFMMQMFPDDMQKAREAGIKNNFGALSYALASSAFKSVLIGKVLPSAEVEAANTTLRDLVSAGIKNDAGVVAQKTMNILKELAPQAVHTYATMLAIEGGTAVADATLNNTAGTNFKISDENFWESAAKGAAPLLIQTLLMKGAMATQKPRTEIDGELKKIADLTPAEKMTAIAMQPDAIEQMKTEAKNAYFDSYKSQLNQYIAQIETRKAQLDKIPNNKNYDFKTLNEASILLQKKSQLEDKLKSTDDAVKFMVEGDLEATKTKIRELFDRADQVNQKNTINLNAKTGQEVYQNTQPEPQQEGVQAEEPRADSQEKGVGGENSIDNTEKNNNFASNEIPEQFSQAGDGKGGGEYAAYDVRPEPQNQLRRRIEEAQSSALAGGGKEPTNQEIEGIAEKFAKENNVWTPLDKIDTLGHPFKSGNENNNYLNDDGYIYKVNNLTNNKGELLSLFDRVDAHNQIFPQSKYEFAGFTGTEGRSAYPIFKQPYFDNSDFASESEIDHYMQSIGFHPTGRTAEYENDDYVISDLRPRNVLKTKDGDIVPIDEIIKPKKSNGQTSIQEQGGDAQGQGTEQGGGEAGQVAGNQLPKISEGDQKSEQTAGTDTPEEKVRPRFHKSEIKDGLGHNFIARDGSIDLGAINQNISDEIRRQSAPIRLSEGNREYGLEHIDFRHRNDIAAFGYDSSEHFVDDVVKNYNEIRKGEKGALFLIKRNGKDKVAVVRLQPSENGDFYNVETAFPAEKKYVDKKELLFSGKSSPDTAVATESDFRSRQTQGNATSLSPTENNNSDANLQNSNQTLVQQRDNLLKNYHSVIEEYLKSKGISRDQYNNLPPEERKKRDEAFLNSDDYKKWQESDDALKLEELNHKISQAKIWANGMAQAQIEKGNITPEEAARQLSEAGVEIPKDIQDKLTSNNTKNEDTENQDTENIQPEQDRTLHRDSADENGNTGGENQSEGREAAEVQKVTEDYTDENGDTVPAEYLNLWLNHSAEGESNRFSKLDEINPTKERDKFESESAKNGEARLTDIAAKIKEGGSKPTYPTIEHNGKTYENRDGEYFANNSKGKLQKVTKPETIDALDAKSGIEKHPTSNTGYSIKKSTDKNGAVHFDFVDNKTGVKVSPSEKTRQKYILEHIAKQQYPETEIHPDATDKDARETILTESKNPMELASEIARMPKYADNHGSKEWFIATTARRVSPESYKRFGDKNNIGIGFAKAYFAKNSEAKSENTIDRWAFAADAARSGGDYGGDAITIDDVINFMHDYRTGAESFLRQPNPEYTDAVNRFREITGLNPSPSVLDALLKSKAGEENTALKEKAERHYDRLSSEQQNKLASEYENWFKSLTLDEQQQELIKSYPYEILRVSEEKQAGEQPQPADGQRKGGENADDKGGAGTKGKKPDSPEYRQAVAERDAAERRVAAAQEKLAKVNRETNRNFADDQENLFGERKSDEKSSLFEERADGEAGKGIIAGARAELEAAIKEYSAANQRVRDFESGKTKGTEEIQFNIVPSKSVSENSPKLSEAKQMFSDGKPLEEIWKETGFFLRQNTKNGNWEWAYRIDQNKMEVSLPEKLSAGDTFKLGNVINYPEFFGIFPDAKNISVKIVNNPARVMEAGLSKDGKTLVINLAHYDIASKSETETKNLIAHELQHLLQLSVDNAALDYKVSDNEKANYRAILERKQETLQGTFRNLENSSREKRETGRKIANIQNALDYLDTGKSRSPEVKKAVDSELERLGYHGALTEREARLAETDFTQSPYESQNADAEKLGIESKDFEAETAHLRNQEAQNHQSNSAEFIPMERPEFNKLIEKLKIPFAKAFEKLNVTTDYEVAKARAKELGENVNDLELKTASGNVYGFKLSDGTLYFNPEKLNANTAFHEFSHLWEQLMPKAWAKGLEIFKETSTGKKVYEQLKSEGNYSKLSEEKLWSEAMNTHIGQKGDESYRNPKGKMAEFVQWMKGIVAKIGEVTGVNKLLGRELTPDDKLGVFTRGVMGDLMGGKELNAEKGAEPYKKIQFSKLDENEKEQVSKVSAIAKIERREPIKIQPKDNHKDIEAIYKSLGRVKNKEDGRNIGIANSVYGKIIRHKGFDYKRIIPQLDKIIEDAVPIYFEPHRNRETHTNIVGMHNYLSKIEVDGREYYVRISAQEMVPSRKLGEIVGQSILHSTYVSDIEIYKSSKPSVTTEITSSATTTAPTGFTDAKLKEFFDSAKDSYEKYKNLLDEKGNIVNDESGVDFHIIGEKGASELDKKEDATRRIDNLATARDMESAGKTDKEIRLATGWERGADGKWRYEIPDISALDLKVIDLSSESINGKAWTDGNVTLGDLFRDIPLFDAYPSLKGVRLSFGHFDNSSTKASYSSSENTIYLPKNFLKETTLFDKNTAERLKQNNLDAEASQDDIGKHISILNEGLALADKGEKVFNLDLNNKEVKSILIHEIQHAIQRSEGFATGGSPEQISDTTNRDKANEITKKAREIFDEQPEEWKDKVRELNRAKIDKDFDKASQIEEEMIDDEAFSKYDNMMFGAKMLMEHPDEVHKSAYDKYLSLAGEVESRNTEKRLSMTAEERRANTLKSTEDVAREDQIIMMNHGGEMMSANKPTQKTPHKTIPAKTFREVSDVFTMEGEEGAMEKLRESAWWKGASDREKAEAETAGIFSFMADQGRKMVENTKVRMNAAKEKAVEKATDREKEKFKLRSSRKADSVEAAKEILHQNIKAATEAGRLNGTLTGGKLLEQALIAVNKAITPRQIRKVVDKVNKIIDDNEYSKKLREANRSASEIKKLIKSKSFSRAVNNVAVAKEFAAIKPSEVENIDEHNRIASQILSNLKGISVNKNLELKNESYQSSNEDIEKYIEKHNAYSEEQKNLQIEDDYNALKNSGALPVKDMTLQEYKDMLGVGLTEEEYNDKLAERKELKKQKEDYLKSVVKAKVRYDLASYDDSGHTPKEKEYIGAIKKIDVEKLTAAQAVKVNDVIENLTTNGSVDGAGQIYAIAKKQEGVKSWHEYISTKSINLFTPKDTGLKRFMDGFKSQEMVFNFITMSKEAAAELQRHIGIFASNSGYAKAASTHDNLFNPYKEMRDKLSKSAGMDLNTNKMRTERGIASIIIQDFGGSKEEVSAYFKMLKNNIDESISRKENLSDDPAYKKLREEGSIEREIFNKYIANSESKEDVMAKMNADKAGRENLKLILEFSKNHEKYKERYFEQARLFNNRDLSLSDADNYNAIRQKKLLGSDSTDETDGSNKIGGKTFLGSGVKEKESTSKIQRVKNYQLAKNKVYNFDFDSVQEKAMFQNIMDIYTAEHVAQIKEFFGDEEEAKKILKGETNYQLALSSVDRVIKAQRHEVPFREDKHMKEVNKFLQRFQKLGAVQALASVFQIPKQYISVAGGTVMNLGKNADLYFKAFEGGNKLPVFDEFLIGRRGTTKAGFVKSSGIEQDAATSKKIISKAGSGIEWLSDKMLKPLEIGDVAVARTSWKAYYMESLRNQGLKTDVDWKNLTKENVNERAASYAEQQLSVTQNVNDASTISKFYGQGDNVTHNIVRTALMPFSSFANNQRIRTLGDLRAMVYGSTEQRMEAAKSLASFAGEQVLFNSIKLAIGKMVTLGGYAVMKKLLGFTDDENLSLNDPETAKKWYTNILSDAVFSGFGNSTQNGLVLGTNIVTNLLFDKKYLYFYDGTQSKLDNFLESIGTYGVGAKGYVNAAKDWYDVFAPKKEVLMKEGEDGKNHRTVQSVDTPAAIKRAEVLNALVSTLALAGVSEQTLNTMNNKIRTARQAATKMELGEIKDGKLILPTYVSKVSEKIFTGKLDAEDFVMAVRASYTDKETQDAVIASVETKLQYLIDHPDKVQPYNQELFRKWAKENNYKLGN